MFLSKLFSKKTPQRKEKVEYITGKLSPIDAVFLSDLEKYPIWVFAIDHEEDYEEGQDESWIAPITNSTDVGEELCDAYILLRVKGNDCPVLAHFDDMLLDVPSPIHLISVPSILGQAAVEFVVNEDRESARIYKHTIP